MDDELVRKVSSPEQMIHLGEEMASSMKGVTCLALKGGLGSGKTHFVKGIAIGMGFQGEVTSPTFTLVHEYPGTRMPVFHFDFYRIDSENELLRLGWDEYLDQNALIAVEWADKFPQLIPSDAQWLEFLIDGENRLVRKIHI